MTHGCITARPQARYEDDANGDAEAVDQDANDAVAAPDAPAGPSTSNAAAATTVTPPPKPKPAPKRLKTAPLASLHNLTLWGAQSTIGRRATPPPHGLIRQ